jgi:trigger factor
MTDETREEPENAAAVTEPPAETPGETDEAKAEREKAEKEKVRQSVEMRDIGPCKKHIKVTIERETIDSRLNDKYSELVSDATVPGFRPGKAPRKIIERRFHKDVSEQVKAELMLASLEQLADEQDIAPLSAPDIDPAKIMIPADGPMVYEFEVEVRPHFDLPNYKGLKLRRPVQTFTDEDVTQEENRLLAPYGQLIPKPAGNAQVGDYLIVDMTTRDGQRVISELAEVKLRVEPRLAFKDAVAERFGEQVRGANAGDKREIEITLSDAAADAALRGKTVKAELVVKEVKSVRLPELTADFLGQFGVRTPEQLRERLRVLLQRRLEYTQRQSAREQVLAEITAASQWELPQDLLMRQARKALNRRVMEMRSSGMSEDEIRGRQRLLEQDVLRSTASALKEHFVLQKIAEDEKIDVDDDDIDNEIDRIAAQNDESPRRLRARLEKDDLIDALAVEIVERKALDLILDSAEYEDVPVGKQERESAVATSEEQAVPGELADPTAVPEEKDEAAPEGKAETKGEATAPAAE